MTVYQLDGKGVVRIEQRFDTDAGDLWSALTEPERLARWIVEVKGELRLDGEFRAKFTSGWEGPGRVDVCEPPSRLLVTMAFAEQDATVIEATISADGDGCRLLVEERGLPLTEAWAHGAGWQAHIEDLAAHLEGRPACDWHARWKELSPSYREQYGSLD
ncbi:SRPBCC family protein [Streptacidiphilus rugosus]|uniref:SRPBCC family protein n=1 Tax=Streptacidiphilus rugosus TaxID=405783 RepID=UPI00056862F1|nr:SRPBCC family protein [Streptacidiphilus rugosus]